jgi:hypothetical protein
MASRNSAAETAAAGLESAQVNSELSVIRRHYVIGPGHRDAHGSTVPQDVPHVNNYDQFNRIDEWL